jgi:hypothetical protein
MSWSTIAWSSPFSPRSSPAIASLTAATGLLDALAQVAPLVAVAQLDRLALAGGGAGRHGRAAHGPALQHDLGLDGGVAAAVQDLAGVDGLDGAHLRFFSVSGRWDRPGTLRLA